MKCIVPLSLALAFTSLLFVTGSAYTQKDDGPKVKDYLEALKNAENWSKNINSPEFYKDYELENTKTKKTAKLKDLTDFERDLFYLLQAENLSKQLAGLNQAWAKEATTAPERYKATTKEDLEKTDRNPDKTDIEESIKKLTQIRKDHAVKFEKIMEDTLSKYTKEIPEKDAKLYQQQVKDFHDHHKLIERKKDNK